MIYMYIYMSSISIKHKTWILSITFCITAIYAFWGCFILLIIYCLQLNNTYAVCDIPFISITENKH